jgi:hypothetical protein
MAWVQIQHAAQSTWDDFEKVGAALGDEQPEGLLLMAAGEVDGRWKAVNVWESKEAFERFLEERLLPAVREARGEEVIAAGPPPTEWFEAKRLMGV